VRKAREETFKDPYLVGHDVAGHWPITNIKKEIESTVIKEEQFKARDDLKGAVIGLDGVTHIGKHSFAQCKNITAVALPSTLKTIDFGAFRGCTALCAVTVPQSCTRVAELAFQYCISLETAKIPHKTKLAGVAKYQFYTIPFTDCKKAKIIRY
jgi:hypothetical protein